MLAQMRVAGAEYYKAEEVAEGTLADLVQFSGKDNTIFAR